MYLIYFHKFNLGSIQLYAIINARRLLVYISSTVYNKVLIYTAEWTGAMQSEKLAQGFNIAAQDSRYKIQEALFNVGLHVNLITLAHLSYFPTNKCKATRHKT